jgi:hypothetical protein
MKKKKNNGIMSRVIVTAVRCSQITVPVFHFPIIKISAWQDAAHRRTLEPIFKTNYNAEE